MTLRVELEKKAQIVLLEPATTYSFKSIQANLLGGHIIIELSDAIEVCEREVLKAREEEQAKLATDSGAIIAKSFRATPENSNKTYLCVFLTDSEFEVRKARAEGFVAGSKETSKKIFEEIDDLIYNSGRDKSASIPYSEFLKIKSRFLSKGKLSGNPCRELDSNTKSTEG